MIERKKKTCKTCQTPQYLWAYGNCKECDAKVKAQNKPKVGDIYQEKEISIDPSGAEYHKEFRIVSVKPSKPRATKVYSTDSKESKPLSELLKLAVTVFHKWVRKRDSFDGWFNCICCGKFKPIEEMDACHYMNAGNHSATKFHEHNVNGGCTHCNRFLDGNLIAYRGNLVNKIGLKAVRELETLSLKSHKWDREELYNIINTYK